MKCDFAKANETHLETLATILNYYVANTTVTFHKEAISAEGMREKIFFDKPWYAAFVMVVNEEVIGYCAVSPWKKQEAYRNTAEVNIYLRHDVMGKGIGSEAILYLEQFALDNQIHTLIAGLCSENIPSRKLFERNGYEHCATFKEVGRKFDRLLDTIYFQKILNHN